MKELYITKRNSKEFNTFLKRMEEFGISFTEDEDNGIFIKGDIKQSIAKKILYRESGISRTWRVSKESKATCKGKNIQEDFVPMLDDEFFNVYMKSILQKLFNIE